MFSWREIKKNMKKETKKWNKIDEKHIKKLVHMKTDSENENPLRKVH